MKRFNNLPPEILEEFHEKLMEGAPVAQIARWMRDDKGQCLDLTEDSLRQYIYNYVTRSHFFRKQVKNFLGEISAIVKSFKENMTPDEGYQFLLHLQMERVMAAYEREKQGKNTTTVNREIALLEKILKNMSNIETDRNLRFIRSRNSEEPIENIKDGMFQSLASSHGEDAARLVMNDSSRRKVLGLIEMLRSRADGPLKKIIDRQKEVIDITAVENKDE